jgi:beta-galactosidase
MTTSTRVSLKVTVPSDWIDQWHHLMATYDGKHMRFYIDEKEKGFKKQSGKIINAPFPINLCRNWETDDQNFTGKMSSALMDRVAVFDRLLTPTELKTTKPNDAILWLDFESAQETDDFYSFGIGGRTYGLIWADRNVQPELFQVKKSAQPVEVSPVDLSLGKIKIKNWHHFTNLKELQTSWQISNDKGINQSGTLDLNIEPQNSSTITIPYTYPKEEVRHYLTIVWTIPENTDWAEAGHEVAFAQFEIPLEIKQKTLTNNSQLPLELKRLGDDVHISGNNFTYTFSRSSGTIASIKFHDKEIIKSGPKMNVWRAPLANDLDGWTFDRARVIDPHPALSNFAANGFWAAGLDKLEHHVDKFEVREQTDKISIHIHTHASAKNNPTSFQNKYVYEIKATGDILLRHIITPEGKMPNYLPKMGLSMELEESFRNWKWKGRGPFETYPDRKTAARFGVWETTVDEAYVPYLIPQDHSNRTDVSWSVHTNEEVGLFIQFDKPLNVSLQKWETENLSRALLIPQLKSFDGLTLNIDPRVSGVGCTAVSILNKYRVFPSEVTYMVRFIPFDVKETDPVDLSYEPWQ